MPNNSIRCTSCGLDLQPLKSKPLPSMYYRWLHSPDWKVRLPFCASCVADSFTIAKLKFDFCKSKLRIESNEEWGEKQTLDEYVLYATNGMCKSCKKKIPEGESIRDGWFLHHKSCLGIYDNIKND